MRRALIAAGLMVVILILMAFDSDAGEQKSYANARNDTKCLVCHGQLGYLISAAGDEAAGGLYIDPAFVDDRIHGRRPCDACHRGNPDTLEKEKAHERLISDPTADGGEKLCSPCHQEVVEKFRSSIHFTISGIEKKLSDRLGTTPHKEEVVGKIMEESCLSCHSTCGDCHVGIPSAGGGGLQEGHLFVGKPDNSRVCLPCHYLKIGFFAEQKNLHSGLGMECTSCHTSEQEYHGRGVEEPEGYWTAGLIKADCRNCHRKVDSSNEAHEIHNDRIACQSCHGSEYDNCIDCHEGKAEKVKGFKLGDYKGKIYPFVNTASVTADMFSQMGIELKEEDLKEKITWVPFPTHFLELSPVHKEGAESMCENCHGNPDIFLKKEDLLLPELEKGVLVDPLPGKLD